MISYTTTAWLTTRDHSFPVSSTELVVFVSALVGGCNIGNGFTSRPVSGLSFSTDDELRDSELFRDMEAEAKATASVNLAKVINELKPQ